MAERSLKLETIQRALEEPARLEANSAVVAVHARGDWSKGPSAKEYVSLPETVSVGLNACKAWGQGPRTEEDWRVIKDWSNGDDLHKAAALYAYGPKKAPIDLIREGLKSHSDVLLPAGLYAAQGKSFEKELVLEALMSRAGSRFELKDLGDLPERMQISGSDIRKWLNSSCEYERYLAVRASINRSVPVGWLFDVAENEQYPDIRDAVVNVLRRWNVTARALKTYWNWYCSQQKRNVSLFILGICAGRDDVKSIIREGVESWFGNAPEACRGVNFSLAEINKWRNSVSSSERAAAMYASIGRPDVPDEWIAESLNDGVCFVE